MRNFLYTVAVFFFAFGCKPGIPKDIIQPEEMAKVLHDIHLADSYLGMVSNSDSAKLVAASYYKGIYKKYGIDSALYTKSMEYYYRDPKALNDIYEKVTSQLTKEKNALVKADSIFNAREVAKIQAKYVMDSTRTADSTFWANFLLRDSVRLKLSRPIDTTKMNDTLSKRIDIMRLKMDYKGPKDLK